MYRVVSYLRLWLLGWLLCGVVAGQEPEVLVELGRKRIFEGESVRYTVTLNRCDDSATPTLPESPDLQFRLSGKSVLRQTTFDGFKRVSIGGPRYEYVLTPQASGEVTIPGPTVVVDGKPYRGATLKLQVLPPTEQDLAFLSVSASRTAVYPLQPFTVRLTVTIKGLPEPYADQDPLRGVGEVPVLVIPWADDESLPDGVNPDTPGPRWLNELLQQSRRPLGFGINNLRVGANDLFAMLTEQQRAIFRPEPRRIKREDAQGRKVDYWEYTFERSMTASKIGRLSFGPISLKGTFAVRASPAGGVDVEDAYAVAKPIVIEVRDVPEEGRPASYIGAVGRFEAEAELTPTAVKVGDPMTLLLRLRGQGALDDAVAPKLDQIPEIAGAFRVYEATEDSSTGERRFTYSLRPLKAGTEHFPAVELAYFDFEHEKYVALRTKPIPIQVAEADRLANQDVAMAASPSSGGTSTIETSAGGIFANITDPRQVYDERVRPEPWFLSLGSMAGVFVICGLVTRKLQQRRGDPVLQRKRLAVKRAMQALEESRQLATAGSHRQTLESLSALIIGLVADAAGRSELGLTSGDVAQELSKLGIDERLVGRCRRLLHDFDAARYGEESQSLQEHVRTTEQALADLTREFRHRKLVA